MTDVTSMLVVLLLSSWLKYSYIYDHNNTILLYYLKYITMLALIWSVKPEIYLNGRSFLVNEYSLINK